jgi:hypothetical protein
MSLDHTKLEHLQQLRDGSWQARCPACAADGHDRSGDHLHVYPDGRYGCAKYPQDSAHRRKIWELAGERNQERVPHAPNPSPPLPKVSPANRSTNASGVSILSAIVGSSNPNGVNPDATDGVNLLTHVRNEVRYTYTKSSFRASVASENGVQAAERPQNYPAVRNRLLDLVPTRCAISRPELCRLSQPGLTPEQVADILRELVLQGAIRTWREGCPEIGTLEVFSKGVRR